MNSFPIHCKKCRLLMFDAEQYSVVNGHLESVSRSQDNKLCQQTNERTMDLYLKEEPYPSFIQEAINKCGWQKGKLHCPKCSTRIGSFNFLKNLQCDCKKNFLPSIHLHQTKIDFVLPSNQNLLQDADTLTIRESTDPLTEEVSTTMEATELNSLPRSCFCKKKFHKKKNKASAESRSNSEEESPDDVIPQTVEHSVRIRWVEISSDDVTSLASQIDNSAADDNISFEDNFICPICLDLFFRPFEVKPCNHIYCEPCLRRLGNQNPTATKCPMCREVIGDCLPCRELNLEIKSKYSEILHRRHLFENELGYQHFPLPSTREYRLFGTRTNANFNHYWMGWKILALILLLDILSIFLAIGFKVFLGEYDFSQFSDIDDPPQISFLKELMPQESSVEEVVSYANTYMNINNGIYNQGPLK